MVPRRRQRGPGLARRRAAEPRSDRAWIARAVESVRTRTIATMTRSRISADAATRSGDAAVPRAWHVVVPVKPAGDGKSRLLLGVAQRASIVRAIALDTVEAAASSARVARVVVVGGDAELAASLAGSPRVEVVADPALGLAGAIELGASIVGPEHPRAVLLGDLPALRGVELSHALGLAHREPRAFVPDADGVGTVLATARSGERLDARFGRDSAAAHRAHGFVELAVPASWGLRRDLDVVEHLPALRRAGLGPRTARALAEPTAEIA